MRKTFVLILFVFLANSFASAQNGIPTASPLNATTKSNNLIKDLGDYTLELPNATWRVTSNTANAELVYGDRLDGFLQVRKISVDDGASFADVIDREQTQKLQFLPAFVNGKEENFKGVLSGKVANYEFTQSGKPMIGRAYFLQADNKTVYVLRFTGLRDKLRLLRNQTDAIARNFELKK